MMLRFDTMDATVKQVDKYKKKGTAVIKDVG
jgi:hypothetical protein